MASKNELFDQISQDWMDAYSSKDFSDVKIVCGEEVFDCHQVVLAARSPVFRAMFHSNMKIKKQKSQPSCRIDLFKCKFIYDIAKHGNTDQYRMIMDKVEDKNPPNHIGNTPLHMAAIGGDICNE